MKTTCIIGRHGFLIGLLSMALGGAVVRAGELTEELHRSYPLAADGQLSLANVNGSVRISIWDRSEVKLDAIKHARKQEHLDAVKIEVESKPNKLTIRTKYPDSKKWFGNNNSTKVDYTLKVPASIRLKSIDNVNGTIEIDGVGGETKASTVNGSLTVRGLVAQAKLSSVNGRIQAGVTSLEGVESLEASTVNGTVELNLPAHVDADLAISTVNGAISGDIPVKKHWPLGCECKTRLGEGGTRINASTVNGAVRVNLAKAPAS